MTEQSARDLLDLAPTIRTKAEDRRFQLRCALAAVEMKRLGYVNLSIALEREALRCHSCGSAR